MSKQCPICHCFMSMTKPCKNCGYEVNTNKQKLIDFGNQQATPLFDAHSASFTGIEHKVLAMMGIDSENLTDKEHRQHKKALNFMSLYGGHSLYLPNAEHDIVSARTNPKCCRQGCKNTIDGKHPFYCKYHVYVQKELGDEDFNKPTYQRVPARVWATGLAANPGQD